MNHCCCVVISFPPHIKSYVNNLIHKNQMFSKWIILSFLLFVRAHQKQHLLNHKLWKSPLTIVLKVCTCTRIAYYEWNESTTLHTNWLKINAENNIEWQWSRCVDVWMCGCVCVCVMYVPMYCVAVWMASDDLCQCWHPLRLTKV